MDIKFFTAYVCIGLLIVIVDKLKQYMTSNSNQKDLLENHNESSTSNSSQIKNIYLTTLTTEFEKYITTEEVTDKINLDEKNVTGFDTENTTTLRNTTEKEVNYTALGIETLEKAESIINSGVWNFDRRTPDGDAIFTRKLSDGHIVLRLTGVVNMSAKELFFILYDDLEQYPKWNPSFLECRVLKKIDDHTDISYQVSSPGARGYVSSRDFVTLRYWTKQEDNYLSGSRSVDFEGEPENLDYTRGENGPSCWELRPLESNANNTEFRWLLNTKLNGWIPQIFAENAFKKFMTKYMINLRQYALKLKEKQSEITPS